MESNKSQWFCGKQNLQHCTALGLSFTKQHRQQQLWITAHVSSFIFRLYLHRFFHCQCRLFLSTLKVLYPAMNHKIDCLPLACLSIKPVLFKKFIYLLWLCLTKLLACDLEQTHRRQTRHVKNQQRERWTDRPTEQQAAQHRLHNNDFFPFFSVLYSRPACWYVGAGDCGTMRTRRVLESKYYARECCCHDKR